MRHGCPGENRPNADHQDRRDAQCQGVHRPLGPGWSVARTQRTGRCKAHFIDLCRVLGVSEPDDPYRYTFKKGLTRTGSGNDRINGFADVSLKGHFASAARAAGSSAVPCRIAALV